MSRETRSISATRPALVSMARALVVTRDVTTPVSCTMSSAAVCELLGELAHLLGDDREAAARVAGARRFDRRVEREQVRLIGDRARPCATNRLMSSTVR